MTFSCQFGGAPKKDAARSPALPRHIQSRSHAKPRARYTLQYQVRPGANFRSIGSPGQGGSMRAITPVKEACGYECSFARQIVSSCDMPGGSG